MVVMMMMMMMQYEPTKTFWCLCLVTMETVCNSGQNSSKSRLCGGNCHLIIDVSLFFFFGFQ